MGVILVLDEVKRGNGRVVPSRQIQVVQTLEGGIVGEILVQEGAIVQQGQSLMRIDDTKFASEFGEIRERRAALAARAARLEAEARGRSEVSFPRSTRQGRPRGGRDRKQASSRCGPKRSRRTWTF